MPNPTKKSNSHQTAQQHTVRMRTTLQGRTFIHDTSPYNVQRNRDKVQESSKYRNTTTADQSQCLVPAQSQGHLLTIGQRLQRPKARGRLAWLLRRADYLTQLNQIFRALLPIHLHNHATLIALNADEWVIQTDSPAWATRLRYQLPNLQRQLGENLGKKVPPLRIRITPTVLAPLSPPPRRIPVPAIALKRLEETARTVSDRELGAALRRLARHARQHNR